MAGAPRSVSRRRRKIRLAPDVRPRRVADPEGMPDTAQPGRGLIVTMGAAALFAAIAGVLAVLAVKRWRRRSRGEGGA